MRGRRRLCTFTGLLLIAAALSLTLYNISESRRAGSAAADAVSSLRVAIEEAAASAEPVGEVLSPEYTREPSMEMPCVTVDGREYIGIVELPSLSLSLPVLAEWSYEGLDISCARYSGSVYLDSMIIFAHNYTSHFGRLGLLGVGDEVVFTDVDGNVFRYAVTELESIDMNGVEDMLSGEWDLTLFTCTMSGKSRFTVRCERVSP